MHFLSEGKIPFIIFDKFERLKILDFRLRTRNMPMKTFKILFSNSLLKQWWPQERIKIVKNSPRIIYFLEEIILSNELYFGLYRDNCFWNKISRGFYSLAGGSLVVEPHPLSFSLHCSAIEQQWTKWGRARHTSLHLLPSWPTAAQNASDWPCSSFNTTTFSNSWKDEHKCNCGQFCKSILSLLHPFQIFSLL